jgi:hypothetical protein
LQACDNVYKYKAYLFLEKIPDIQRFTGTFVPEYRFFIVALAPKRLTYRKKGKILTGEV